MFPLAIDHQKNFAYIYKNLSRFQTESVKYIAVWLCMHIPVDRIRHLGACSAQNLNLSRCLFKVNCIISNRRRWYLRPNTKHFVDKNSFEHVRKMATPLMIWPLDVNMIWYWLGFCIKRNSRLYLTYSNYNTKSVYLVYGTHTHTWNLPKNNHTTSACTPSGNTYAMYNICTTYIYPCLICQTFAAMILPVPKILCPYKSGLNAPKADRDTSVTS